MRSAEDRIKGFNKKFQQVKVTPSELSFRGHRVMAQEQFTKIKRRKLFKLSVFATIPALIVIGQNISNLVQDVKNHESNNILELQVRSGVKMGKLIHQLQVERGTTALYISSKKDPVVGQRLQTMYALTDTRVSSLTSWKTNHYLNHFRSSKHFNEYLTKFRSTVPSENISVQEVLQFYTELNTVFGIIIGENININISVEFWTEISAFELLLYGKEQTGIERALGSTYYARGAMPHEDLLLFNEKRALGHQFLKQSMSFSHSTRDHFNVLLGKTQLASEIDAMRDEISRNMETSSSAIAGTIWFDNMTEYINILEIIHDKLAMNIVQHAIDENLHLERTLSTCAIQLTVATFMVPLILFLVKNVVNISGVLEKKTAALEEEKQQTESLLLRLEDERNRTEQLLYRLLPMSVAKTIMEDRAVIPESYNSATIMFSDVVGFTRISSHISPMQVVSMLNSLFVTVDCRLENFDVYKVETVGDGYLVASGLPQRNGDKHVQEIAKLALDLLKTVDEIDIPYLENKHLQIRIGIHTGPCVAGVVGTKMPRYCLFGDTVNTASRMESTGLPMRIQTTNAFAGLLYLLNKFEISERGQIDVKGKGLMTTYWLEGYKNQHISVNLIESMQDQENAHSEMAPRTILTGEDKPRTSQSQEVILENIESDKIIPETIHSEQTKSGTIKSEEIVPLLQTIKSRKNDMPDVFIAPCWT